MINSKLIKLYTALNSQEKEAFHKWLKSPLHNNDTALIKLFVYVAGRRKLSKTSLNRQKVYKVIFPQNKYDDLRLRHLLTKGVKNLELFVAFWMSKKSTVEQKVKLIEFLRNRQRPALVKQQITHLKKTLDQRSHRNHQYFYQQYLTEQQVFEQVAAQNRMKETNLQDIFDIFSTSFIVENLRYACIAASHENLYKTSYDIPFLAQTLAATQQAKYQSIAAIQLYYNAYMALKLPNEKRYFDRLISRLFEDEHLLPVKERRNLYTLTINYCIRRINTDESMHYLRQVFELYRKGLETETLLDAGLLSRFTFKNMMTAGLRLKEYDWVEHNIPLYVPYLKAAYQDNYQHYIRAKLYFAKGDYDKTMQQLIQVEYADLFLNLDAKTMLMKIYFQQHNFDVLDALFHSFTIYLQRKEIMGYHRNNYLNIIKLTKKLLDLDTKTKQEKEQFRRLIQETQPLTEREWLLDQIPI